MLKLQSNNINETVAGGFLDFNRFLATKRKENQSIMTVSVDMKALLESGAHFGHKTSRWHPKMAQYIHSKRQGGHIINLEKTAEALEAALPEVSKIAASGKKVLFVGTKKQLKDITKVAAESVNMPYVTVRWVGGILTNVDTVNRQIKKLDRKSVV